jgi:hypothetical protein
VAAPSLVSRPLKVPALKVNESRAEVLMPKKLSTAPSSSVNPPPRLTGPVKMTVPAPFLVMLLPGALLRPAAISKSFEAAPSATSSRRAPGVSETWPLLMIAAAVCALVLMSPITVVAPARRVPPVIVRFPRSSEWPAMSSRPLLLMVVVLGEKRGLN